VPDGLQVWYNNQNAVNGDYFSISGWDWDPPTYEMNSKKRL